MRNTEPSSPKPALHEVGSEPPDAISAEPTARRRPRARIVLVALVATFAVAGATAWIAERGRESTDDAQVEAHVANVAARVPGQVLKVLVRDNQLVRAGDALVELDDRDAHVKQQAARADLESAKANLEAAEAQLSLTERSVSATLRQASGGMRQAGAMTHSSRAGIAQSKADVAAAESRFALAETDLRRAERLRAEGATSQADLDAKKALHEQAQANLEQSRARLASAQAGIASAAGNLESAQGRLLAAQTGPQQAEVARAQVAVARARVAQAQAALEQADLNLSYMTITAQIGGVVSRRTVEPGQMVAPERPLMSITALDDEWVVANFKEDQVAEMRAGQKARVRIDAFGGRAFPGKVESLAGGTGSRFSLLPPDNASGNFTKVVQRVPVLVRLDGLPGDVVLRPGMSADVTVYTR